VPCIVTLCRYTSSGFRHASSVEFVGEEDGGEDEERGERGKVVGHRLRRVSRTTTFVRSGARGVGGSVTSGSPSCSGRWSAPAA
jgi:hypothetical protein